MKFYFLSWSPANIAESLAAGVKVMWVYKVILLGFSHSACELIVLHWEASRADMTGDHKAEI